MSESEDKSEIMSKPEEIAPVKTTSEKKRRANQENGRKSRGPSTPHGKSHSRWNSFQHSFFAKDLSIVKGKHLPDYEDFVKLHKALREELNPQSITEELLVENFAVNCWRRARSLKYEFEVTELNFAFLTQTTGLATLVRYQTAVGRELAQADDAIKQMAERSRISNAGEDSSDSISLPEEETESGGTSDGTRASAAPDLTERTK